MPSSTTTEVPPLWGAAPPEGNYFVLPQQGKVRVAGTSYRRTNIKRIVALGDRGPSMDPGFSAALVAEPDNPHDRHAVVVLSAAGPVGYLPRAVAPEYGPALASATRKGFDGLVCNATVTDTDAPAVRLHLPEPFVLQNLLHLFTPVHYARDAKGRLTHIPYSEMEIPF